MKTLNKIEIPLSKKKLSIAFAGSLGFVIAGVWFVIKRPTSNALLLSNSTTVFVTGVITILFFGLCTIYYLLKLRDNTPGLIINDQGITDNSSGTSAGFIPWKDILDIKTITMRNVNTIGLEVVNPEKYIDRQKSFIKRMIMQANYKIFDSPIYISSVGLKCTSDELYQWIMHAFNTKKTS